MESDVCDQKKNLHCGCSSTPSVVWSSPLDGQDVVGKLHAGHLGGISYGSVIRWNVSRKWKTQELKEWWYAKFTMSRRRKLVALFNKQSGRCVFCNCETWLAVEGSKKQRAPEGMQIKQMATADHIIPQSEGGTDKSSNLAMACTACNNARQTTPFDEFLEARSDPVKWKARNIRLTNKYRENASKRRQGTIERQQKLIWKLAILFLVRPELAEVALTLPNKRGRRD